MAFLRFTRDKRGYEQFALLHPVMRRGKSVSRVLYWYRTPPDIKLGREPFDDAVRKALEAQNPDIAFDWRKIIETPIPSADAEKWRERRRAERAERAARQASEREDEEAMGAEQPPDAPVHVIEAAAEASVASVSSTTEVPATAAAASGRGESVSRHRKRRRRRGGRGRPPGQPATASATTPVNAGEERAPDQDE